MGGLTDTTATLTWTVPETTNTITGYAWQYRKAGDTDWSTEVTTSSTIATIGGLTADTDYEFRVKTLYGSNASTYATIGFSTAESLPYECGFENGMIRETAEKLGLLLRTPHLPPARHSHFEMEYPKWLYSSWNTLFNRFIYLLLFYKNLSLCRIDDPTTKFKQRKPK